MASAVFEGTSLANMFVRGCWVNGVRRLVVSRRGDEEEFFEIRTEWSDRSVLYLHRSLADLRRLCQRLRDAFPDGRPELARAPLRQGAGRVPGRGADAGGGPSPPEKRAFDREGCGARGTGQGPRPRSQLSTLSSAQDTAQPGLGLEGSAVPRCVTAQKQCVSLCPDPRQEGPHPPRLSVGSSGPVSRGWAGPLAESCPLSCVLVACHLPGGGRRDPALWGHLWGLMSQGRPQVCDSPFLSLGSGPLLFPFGWERAQGEQKRGMGAPLGQGRT